jgi:NAD(P)-dependent dehydrogenase (short-subunit alcohol dehydrogenase family)
LGALENKVAFVTGASRGIGEAIARRFAAEGATVVVTARTADASGRHLPGSVEETVRAIESAGGRAIGLVCDIGEPASRAACADRILRELGRVDVLVNNAAAASYGTLYPRISEKLWARLWETNLHAPLDFAQRFAPAMAERGAGWIVNISSRTAEHPSGPPFNAFERGSGVMLYGATKAALNRLTAGLAAELDESGVAVNALAPFSVVWTPGAAAVGTAKYRSLPGWKEEPVEAMAEAALALATCDTRKFTGRCVFSTELLAELGREVRTLDGARVLGDWKPAID